MLHLNWHHFLQHHIMIGAIHSFQTGEKNLESFPICEKSLERLNVPKIPVE